MPINLTDDNTSYPATVTVPVDFGQTGYNASTDRRSAASLKPALQVLANRTAWLNAQLSALNASNLTAGTVPLARISGLTDTQVAAGAAIAWSKLNKAGSSLADLTTRSASDLTSGTLPDARFPATLPAVSGINLTGVEKTANKGVAGGYASLDGTGKIPFAQIPAVAITDTFSVASQSAMLALTAQRGDVAVRTDLSESFILTTDDPTQLANWQQLLHPSATITSFNGRGGAVTLTAGDVTGALTYTPEDASKKGAANGYASLDATSKLPAAQLPATAEVTGNKGQANGYASLDGTGKVPAAQLPSLTGSYITFNVTGATSGQPDTWESKTAMGTARSQGVVGEISGILYYACGDGGGPSGVTEAYDPSTNTWTTKASATARHSPVGGVINGKLYAVGGQTAGGTTNINEEYTPGSNTWASKAVHPTNITEGAGSIVNNTLHTLGGSTTGGGAATTTHQQYDPTGNAWTAKAACPAARKYQAAATLNGKIYMIGGSDGTTQQNGCYEYDPTGNSWATKANMPTARYFLGAAADPNTGLIHAIGGIDTGYLVTNEAFNPTTNTWATKTAMTGGRRCMCVYYGGKIYVLGGYNGSYLATNQAYISSETYTRRTAAGIGSATAYNGNNSLTNFTTGATGRTIAVKNGDQWAPTFTSGTPTAADVLITGAA
jgi:N-acetylneuraminic acid mutarotase